MSDAAALLLVDDFVCRDFERDSGSVGVANALVIVARIRKIRTTAVRAT